MALSVFFTRISAEPVHCSPLHHAQLNLLTKGSLRISHGWSTTKDEIDHCLSALSEFCKVMRKLNVI